MSEETPLDRAKRNANGIAAVTVTGTWLAMLMLGMDGWLAVMLFGYIVIVPVVSMLFDEEGEDEADEANEERTSVSKNAIGSSTTSGERTDTTDALDRLRSRYADGQLTDEQFERKLDRLLETETVEDAAEWVARGRAGTGDEASGDVRDVGVEQALDGQNGSGRATDIETGSNR